MDSLTCASYLVRQAQRERMGNLTDHGLDIRELFAVFNSGDAIPTDHGVNLALRTTLGFREEDHGHHPPCQDAEGCLTAGAVDRLLDTLRNQFRSVVGMLC